MRFAALNYILVWDGMGQHDHKLILAMPLVFVRLCFTKKLQTHPVT